MLSSSTAFFTIFRRISNMVKKYFKSKMTKFSKIWQYPSYTHVRLPSQAAHELSKGRNLHMRNVYDIVS